MAQALPRHDVRLPDERSRLRAHQGHARVARARRGDGAGRRRRARVQHVHDPREARHEARRVPRRGSGAQAAAPGLVVAVGGCYAEAQRERIFELYPVRRRRVRAGVDPASRRMDRDGRVRGAPRALRLARARSPPRCRCTASAASARGCRSRWAATRSARTASSPPCEDASRAADPARSSPRSRPLARDGVKEITLLGQNVNSWGRDLAPDIRTEFGELLRACDAVEGIERIRFTSPHPKDFREPVIAAMAECRAVCEHVHLPLQSGLDAGPEGDATHVHARALSSASSSRLRDAIPDLALGTDIIVGFPGETEADFAETLEVVEEVGFDSAFTFVYSPRAGTEAAVDARPGPGGRQARAHGAARRGRPARRVGPQRGAGRPRRGGARRGAEPDRSDASPWPDATEHDGQLRRRARNRAISSRSRSSARRRRRCVDASAPAWPRDAALRVERSARTRHET